MTEMASKSGLPGRRQGNEENRNLQGYPLYPSGEDIYCKYTEERDINPEDISTIKQPNEDEKNGSANEKDFSDDESGSDLDIPGAELDDEDEITGNEDEENNLYSSGDDERNDLDEDK